LEADAKKPEKNIPGRGHFLNPLSKPHIMIFVFAGPSGRFSNPFWSSSGNEEVGFTAEVARFEAYLDILAEGLFACESGSGAPNESRKDIS
jgi:hypothetical protein